MHLQGFHILIVFSILGFPYGIRELLACFCLVVFLFRFHLLVLVAIASLIANDISSGGGYAVVVVSDVRIVRDVERGVEADSNSIDLAMNQSILESAALGLLTVSFVITDPGQSVLNPSFVKFRILALLSIFAVT